MVRATPDGISSAGRMVRVQTPQAFRARALLDAYRQAAAEAFEGTDTSSCVERFTDVDVRVFAGTATNLKVTYARDVLVAAALLRHHVIDDSR